MKKKILSYVSIGAAGLYLSACSVKAGSPPNFSPATPVVITSESAKGQVNGKPFEVKSAKAEKSKDAQGREIYTVTLSNATLDCKSFAGPNQTQVFLTVPAATGTFSFPNATAVFSYFKGNAPENEIAGDSSVIIDAIEASQVKGRVSASFDKNNVSGAFTAVLCGQAAKPVTPQQPVPVPQDMQKIFSGWGSSWSGDNARTPGAQGSLSFWLRKTNDQPKASETKFHMGGMCAYAEMGKGGVGLQWGSEVGGDFLTLEAGGRIFLNCWNGKTEVGQMTATEIRIDTISCTNLHDDKKPLGGSPMRLALTSSSEADLSKTFPATPAVGNWPASPPITCSGKVQKK